MKNSTIKTGNPNHQNGPNKGVQSAVCSNHVHIVVRAINQPHYKVTQMYKRAATNRLRDVGIEGKVWTRGYDVRFCFDEEALKQKIDYVQGHGD